MSVVDGDSRVLHVGSLLAISDEEGFSIEPGSSDERARA